MNRRSWIKHSENSYSLFEGSAMTGEMELLMNSNGERAVFKAEGKVLEIRRVGFWKTKLEIRDGEGTLLLQTWPEKWYANTSVVEYAGKKYKLVVRNNPLAEFAVVDGVNDILAYGLDVGKDKLSVRITGEKTTDIIFDFLLWYLFLPVANENFGGAYSFLLMV